MAAKKNAQLDLHRYVFPKTFSPEAQRLPNLSQNKK
jgi:hypothetical protein